MHHIYLDAIKTFEGFTAQAQWDYAQHSNGFGTKAQFPGESITREEAERRFTAEIAAARSIVEKHTEGWDEGTKAALTSLTFNAGTRWITSGLGDAVRRHDIEAVKDRFAEYTKAQGQELPGLVKRRLAEIEWIGKDFPGSDNTTVTALNARPPAETASGTTVVLANSRAATASQTAITALDRRQDMTAETDRGTIYQALEAVSESMNQQTTLFSSGGSPTQWQAFAALLIDLQLQSDITRTDRNPDAQDRRLHSDRT